jgi:hypothetical protein
LRVEEMYTYLLSFSAFCRSGDSAASAAHGSSRRRSRTAALRIGRLCMQFTSSDVQIVRRD